MTTYELVQRKADGVHIIDKVVAGTKAQATRKLFRRTLLSPETGAQEGYSVEVANQSKTQGKTNG